MGNVSKNKNVFQPMQNQDTREYKRSNKVFEYLFGELNENKIKHLMVYLISLSILEIFSYKVDGLFSIISSKVWLLGGVICLISIIGYFSKSLLIDIKENKFLSVISIFVLIISLFSFIGNINISEINPDATQQAAAGLDSFNSSDLNYTGKAFLGYPNRQYIITAIPALLFGRSIATLQLGFALPFILGLLLLYSALRTWAQRLGINTILAVLPLYALFVFPFITEYYINFEQAIYPISFTMIIMGFYLIILSNPNMISFIGFAWIGCLLSNSYTPALATLGLTIVFIILSIYLLLKRPDLMPFSIQSPVLVSKAFMLVEINIIAFLIATFLDKRQDKLNEVQTDIDIFNVSYNSIIDFLTDKNAGFIGMFGVLVIIYIFASLTLQLKKRDLLISLWILGVFAASNLLKGYTSYQPSWIMQRALIIVPVVLAGIILTIFDIVCKYKFEIKQSLVVIMIISFGFIGLYNFKQINQSFTYFNYIQPLKYMFNDLEETIKSNDMDSEDEFNLILYTDNALIKNPADYCKFLYPNANVYVPEFGQFPAEIDSNLVAFVYGDCEFYEGIPLEDYDLVTFDNIRHDMIVNWYKGKIMN